MKMFYIGSLYAVLSMNFDVRNILSHLEIADISERVRPNAYDETTYDYLHK